MPEFQRTGAREKYWEHLADTLAELEKPCDGFGRGNPFSDWQVLHLGKELRRVAQGLGRKCPSGSPSLRTRHLFNDDQAQRMPVKDVGSGPVGIVRNLLPGHIAGPVDNLFKVLGKQRGLEVVKPWWQK